MKTVASRQHVVLVVGSLVLLAWSLLWLGGRSPYARYLSHEGLGAAELGSWFGVLAVIGGWLLMIMAMMLPTSLPLVALFDRTTRQRVDHASLVGLLVVGYLAVWMLFGLAVVTADRLLHGLLAQRAWLPAYAWLIGAGILVVAGLYQFTSLKSYCLKKCRSPLGFLAEHWQSGGERAHALLLGMRHGFFCIGCCWTLMLLMFAVGMGNLGWMFVLGAVMALEKNVAWGQQLSAPLGVLLISWGSLEAVLPLV